MSCCRHVMKPIDASSCCTPQDTAAKAARAIRDSGCGCAPVLEQPVKRGQVVGELVQVLEGLRPGQNVVTEGSFLLRAEPARTRTGG